MDDIDKGSPGVALNKEQLLKHVVRVQGMAKKNDKKKIIVFVEVCEIHVVLLFSLFSLIVHLLPSSAEDHRRPRVWAGLYVSLGHCPWRPDHQREGGGDGCVLLWAGQHAGGHLGSLQRSQHHCARQPHHQLRHAPACSGVLRTSL